MTTSTKVWTKEEILNLINRSDTAVERAIIAIFKRQTDAERVQEVTAVHNNRGFLPYHARRGSYYAKWIMSGKHLTGDHLAKARSMAVKYTRQLAEDANNKS